MIHSLFPTLVYETQYQEADIFMSVFSEAWADHFTDGYSHEGTGNLNLQTDIRFNDLYKFLTKSVNDYLNASGVVADNFDINFVKSWMNILENRTTPLHAHKDSHISIIYYINTPEDNEQFLRFHCRDSKREPYDGLYLFNSYMATEFNSDSYIIKPYTGLVLVFPSSLLHDTFGDNSYSGAHEPPTYNFEDLKKKRICIASDVILTFSEKKTDPLGLQPTKNWRTFNE